MSPHDKLVKDCIDDAIRQIHSTPSGLAVLVNIVLARVERTLSDVTPEMIKAAFGDSIPSDAAASAAKADFLAMLNASPLVRP